MADTSARLKKAPQILVIEDAGTLLCLLDHVLRQQDYQVVSTDNPLTALELALQLQPDLVVLDVCMPGLDGYSLARSLRDHRETAGVSIIFLSARKTTEDLARAKELGASAYMDKPFRMETFLSLVRGIVDKRRSPKAG